MSYFDELRNAIIAESPKLGLDPVDVASIFSYETGGTFDPWKAGPTTQWGQHFGLFQAGEPQREKYGIKQGMPVAEQVKAFFRYLPDHGVKYGDDLSRVYAAVNAGSADRLLASDAHAGGTKGSVLDKIARDFPDHRLKALALLNQELKGGNFDNVSGDAGTDIQLGNTSADELERFAFNLSGGAAARPDSITGFQPGFRSQLEQLVQSAPPGIEIGIKSGYRSQETQDQLFADAVRRYGSEAAARHWVAKISNHTKGNAADLTYGSDAAREWAHANAGKFGLGFRLGHEPWHIESIDGGDSLVADNSGSDIQLGSDESDQLEAQGLINPIDELNLMERSINPVTKKPVEWSQPMPELQNMVEQEEMSAVENYAKQAAAGTMGFVTSLPWKLAAGVTATGEWAGRNVSELINPDGFDPEAWSITDALWNQGVHGDNINNAIMGIENPATFGELAARMGPESMILPGSGVAKLAAMEAILGIQTFGPPVLEALNEFVFGPAVASAPDPNLINPPMDVDKNVAAVLGPLGAVTGLMTGIPFLARGAGKVVGWNRPKWKDVNGPAGAVSVTNRRDVLGSMGFDTAHGILQALDRSGLPKQLWDHLEDVLKIETRSGAKSLASGAVLNGHAETMTKKFQVNTPLVQIEKAIEDQPAIGQYINVLNVIDRFKVKGAPRTIQGLTSTSANALKRNIEAAHPNVVAAATGYQEFVAELKRFVTTGAFGYNTKDVRKRFNGRPNLVPLHEDITDEAVFHPNPAQLLGNYAHNLITDMLHNSARGEIVDAFRNVPIKEIADGVAIPITKKQLKQNPHWAPNVTAVQRGTKQELVYISDDLIADMMHLDPFEIPGKVGQGLNSVKNVFEFATTREGNPAFSFMAALRNWGSAVFNTPRGYKGPGLINPFLAVPKQLLPKAAKALADNINSAMMRDNSPFWGSMPGTSRALAAMLSNTWMKSAVAKMERYGPHAGTYMDDQTRTLKDYNTGLAGLASLGQNPGRAGQMGKHIYRTVAGLARGWSQILYAVQGAPAFSVAERNMKRRPQAQWPHVVSMAAGVTGNPRQGGQSYVRNTKPGERLDQASGSQRQVRGAGPALTKNTVAVGSEFGRTTVPWWAPITQGNTATIKAYWNDPIRFVPRLWTYMIAPTIGLHMYNRGLGPEYDKYQNEERSLLEQATYLYIGDPNRPPEEGHRFPVPQELSILMALTNTLVRYALPSTNKYGHVIDKQDALWNMAEDYFTRVLIPPVSIIEQLPLVARGVNPPSSMFGDNVYIKRQEPFDQLGSGMGVEIEGFLQGMGGTLGQLFVEAMIAANQTEDEKGYLDALGNGLNEMYQGQLTRLPVSMGVKPMTMDTSIHQELMVKQKSLKELSDFWDQWGKAYLDKEEPRINLKGQSKAGEAKVSKLVGGLGMLGQNKGSDSAPYPGMMQPVPNDPLYMAVMKEIHDKLMTDDDASGLKGFISLNRRLGNIMAAQDSMRGVNDGNMVQWAERIKNDPTIKAAIGGLEGKDKWDPERAWNYLQSQRNQLERHILLIVKAVEQDLSKRAMAAGYDREIKLENLSPYKK